MMVPVGRYIFIAWHLKFKSDFFTKILWKKWDFEQPWIHTGMKNFLTWIQIWIRMESFWIQDPDPYNNSYGSASMKIILIF